MGAPNAKQDGLQDHDGIAFHLAGVWGAPQFVVKPPGVPSPINATVYLPAAIAD
jgi:hypothetical protein